MAKFEHSILPTRNYLQHAKLEDVTGRILNVKALHKVDLPGEKQIALIDKRNTYYNVSY